MLTTRLHIVPTAPVADRGRSPLPEGGCSSRVRHLLLNKSPLKSPIVCDGMPSASVALFVG
jgi:hypothetical protein